MLVTGDCRDASADQGLGVRRNKATTCVDNPELGEAFENLYLDEEEGSIVET